MTDIEIVREAIELFAVNYFETIEMSGTVKAQNKDNINYISIDLANLEWDKNLNKLHQSLIKYLKEWGQKNISNFNNYIDISRLTVEYLLPEKDKTNQNQSRHVKLFYFPSYYYRAAKKNNEKTYSGVLLKFLIFWHNILLRNTIITIIPTIVLIAISICKIHTDNDFQKRLEKSYDYINVASGIIASFVLGFLINKTITIRQDKLKYTRIIRLLSNKLTYFRNICFNLIRDHNFWSSEKPFYKSFEYANSIKHDITFEEYFYPNYDDDIKYSKYKSFFKEDLSPGIILLVLQLHMIADESFLDSGLTYTKFPPDHIYTHDEMKNFILFNDSNRIWYCCSEMNIFPEKFYSSYYIKETIEDINRIYPKNKIEDLSKDKLEEVSLDFQYRIIPRLYNLTRMVDSHLPLTVRYFIITSTLLLMFGLIIPTLIYIFIDKTYAFLSVFVVIGIIGHILLTIIPILEAENNLDRKYDYL
ncbi:hypothetical protein GCM10028818_55070 [Spirosoma horti]